MTSCEWSREGHHFSASGTGCLTLACARVKVGTVSTLLIMVTPCLPCVGHLVGPLYILVELTNEKKWQWFYDRFIEPYHREIQKQLL